MIFVQPYVSAISRLINPSVWKQTWRSLENKTGGDVADLCIRWGDKQMTKLHYIYDRGHHRSPWWSNPMGFVLMVYLTYKSYQLIYISRKQKKAAQLVAAAYGQGGQWLNPVPK